jgi:hypothetical protein
MFAVPLAAIAAVLVGAAVAERQNLGVFEHWGAFRDGSAASPRCYAISEGEDAGQAASRSFASVGFWPAQGLRGQFYARLSRAPSARHRTTLRVGGRSFTLTTKSREAWTRDPAADAAILAALRSNRTMQISARTQEGRRFSNSYQLAGAATAIDAATLACARLR